MADRSCNYCNDRGDCSRCSYFFELDKVHTTCGQAWRVHEVRSNDPSGICPPYAVCPGWGGNNRDGGGDSR